MWAGIGLATNRGPGPVITTAHGSMTGALAGCGSQEWNGHRRGSRGELARTTSVGRLADQAASWFRRRFLCL
jgi:hypothetical protein